MDRSNIITLVKTEYEQDDIGQQVPKETKRDIYCTLKSIGQEEWYKAGNRGLKPEIKAIIFSPEYQNETIAEIDGKRYGIYRTYIGENENLELYLERKAGI